MVAAARRVIDEAEPSGVDVRLFGGIAVWIRSSKAMRRTLGREYADSDLVTTAKQAKGLRGVLERPDDVPDKMFNATQGDTRLYYHSPEGDYHVDVFIEKFVMSRELHLAQRFATEATLPAAELCASDWGLYDRHRQPPEDAVAARRHRIAPPGGGADPEARLRTRGGAEVWRLAPAGEDRAAHALVSDARRSRPLSGRQPAGGSPTTAQHLVEHRHEEVRGLRVEAERRLDLEHVLVISGRLHDHPEL